MIHEPELNQVSYICAPIEKLLKQITNHQNMFDNLSDRLEGAFKSLTGDRKITEINIAESVKEIRRALVGADVNYKIAKEFTETIKEKALGTENVLNAVKPGQLMVKIVQDELTKLMGGQSVVINIAGKPGVV